MRSMVGTLEGMLGVAEMPHVFEVLKCFQMPEMARQYVVQIDGRERLGALMLWVKRDEDVEWTEDASS